MKHATRMAMAWYEMRDFRQARCLETPWVGFHRQPGTSMPGFRLFVGFCFDTLLFRKKIGPPKTSASASGHV